MRPSAWTIAAALTLAGAGAGAQIINPTRAGGNRQPVNATRPLGRLDCESRERITFRVNYPGDGTVFNRLRFWIGAQATSCMDMATRHGVSTNPVCWPIEAAVIDNPQSSTSYNNDFQIEARYLVDPLGGMCASPTTPGRGTINTNYLTLLVDQGSGQVMTGMSFGIPFDLDPPAAPTNVAARPGEGSVEVTWRYTATTTTTTTTTTDVDADTSTDAAVTTTTTTGLAGFWVLCDPPGAGADAGTDAGDAGDAGLDVPGNVLGADAGASCGADFPAIDLYDVAQFNRYARGGFTASTATSLTVTGLAEGVSYRCVVVAEDNAGNRAVSTPSSCVTPVPVTDFWERYRSDGGGAAIECAARPARAGDAVAGLATLSLAAAALAARRRRRS